VTVVEGLLPMGSRAGRGVGGSVSLGYGPLQSRSSPAARLMHDNL
jgi:hypothetical protein